MHPDEASLLLAVCEKPDDDAPRLIYADWLDEAGAGAQAARAEFIRLQIRIEQVPADDSRRAVFEHRAWQLIHDHNPTWLASMGMKLWGVRYRRGFLERAATRTDHILAYPEWFALQPIVELEVQLDQNCWQLVLDMLTQQARTETNDQLAAAWQRACAKDPRLTLIQSGEEAEALGWHPLIQRVRDLRLSVDWRLYRDEVGLMPGALIPREEF